MKLLSTLIFAASLAGCASAPQAPLPPAQILFADAAFKAPDDQVKPEEIFALSPAMKEYARKVRQTLQGRNAHEALFEALYRRDMLRLEYDSELTRTAAQAFEARSGNCLSLVIMTAAFAKELDLTVQFQRITTDETWSRSGTLYFASGHVNLMLGKGGFDNPNSYDRARFLTIDFLPPPDVERMERTPIDESTVVAMFMNNRAAEALVKGKVDNAYWWARNAIAHEPGFMLAYNTLATIYQRHGDLAQSERVLRFAHDREPNSTVILSNLVEVLKADGKTEEAARLQAELARLEPYPPFYFFTQGQQAMQEGDFRKARALFAREVQRAPYYHEFHFWLAKAAFELGDLETADKHMNLALSNSTTRNDSAIYAGKLASLRIYESRVRLRPEKYSN